MPTPVEIIKRVASLQNDSKQQRYTSGAVLPYFNMALDDLQEIFQQNDIPLTYEVSANITVPAQTDPNAKVSIGFTTVPALPSNLIEIKQLWESVTGQELWIPVHKRAFIPHYTEGSQVSAFGIWAWVDNEIKVPNSLQSNDLKIDYIKSIFNEVTLATIDSEMGIEFKNCKSYLQYRTAGLCAMFIGANPTRAAALSSEATDALGRSLGIAIKGKQPISFRRRPFRQSYKLRRRMG